MINLNYHFEVVENQFDIGWEDITYVLQYLYLLLLYTVSPCTVHKSIQKICHTVQELFVQIADPFVKFRTIISFPHCARYSLLIGDHSKFPHCTNFLHCVSLQCGENLHSVEMFAQCGNFYCTSPNFIYTLQIFLDSL